MKYCDFNGCKNKVEKGRYCVDHKPTRKKSKTKKNIYHHENKPFYNSELWEITRSKVLQREANHCQRCSRFVFGRQAQVHHIIPIKKDPTLKVELSNLMLLCPKCHTIVENEGKEQKVFPSYFS